MKGFYALRVYSSISILEQVLSTLYSDEVIHEKESTLRLMVLGLDERSAEASGYVLLQNVG